jgi:hypothetical protein
MLDLSRLAPMLVIRRISENRRLIKAARLIGTLLTIASLLLVFRQGSTELATLDRGLLLWGLLVVLAVYGVSFTGQALAWSLMMGALSQTRAGWRDLEIYAYSNFVRRTPGMIWYLIERVDSYRGNGLGGTVTLLASLLEWLMLLAAATLVIAVTSSNDTVRLLPAITVIALVAGGGLTALSLRRRALLDPSTQVVRSVSGKFVLVRASWPEILLALVVYSGCYLLGGAIVLVLVQVADPRSGLVLSGAASIWALTSVLGLFAAVLIPANVGLREITMVALLLPHTTLTAAATSAAMMRVLFAVADVGYSLACWQTAKWFRSRRT